MISISDMDRLAAHLHTAYMNMQGEEWDKEVMYPHEVWGSGFSDAVFAVMDVCKEVNPRFDSDRFYNAVINTADD